MRITGKNSADVIYVAVEALNHARSVLFHYSCDMLHYEGISKT